MTSWTDASFVLKREKVSEEETRLDVLRQATYLVDSDGHITAAERVAAVLVVADALLEWLAGADTEDVVVATVGHEEEIRRSRVLWDKNSPEGA